MLQSPMTAMFANHSRHSARHRVYHAAGVCTCTALLSALGACGASHQAIYEGEVRFEHCYRLDQESTVPVTQRKECWREWTKFYTYGQSRDRIEHALARQRVLQQAVNNPGVESDVDDERLAPATLAAPAPTSPFKPPPPVQSATFAAFASAEPPRDAEPIAAGLPPGHECFAGCRAGWDGCRKKCEGRHPSCHQACDKEYKTCVARCL